MRRPFRAFTIIELLVVVAIIALLIGILLPAIGKARDQAKLTQSLSNLRNLGTAHANYAAEWNDRQVTWIDDNMGSYGNSAGPAFNLYNQRHGANGEGSWHPPVTLGWGHEKDGNGQLNGIYRVFRYFQAPGMTGNHSLVQPITFRSADGIQYFGSFRLINGKEFSQYVSGRFYDKVFYAPKDTICWEAIEEVGCFDDPGEFCDNPPVPGIGDIPKWSSYVLSPAAMFSPEVMKGNAFTVPWLLPGGFRSPAMGQALYPNLKTHMLEHHWLQARPTECNPGFTPGAYSCEPWYFNHGWESTPAALFYDGHVETVGSRKAERADGRDQAQGGPGLWHRGTTFGVDGYFIDLAYDLSNTSYHVLTTDGIRGRDFVSD